MKITGIILLVLGLLGVVYGGITYTTRDTIVDIGPLHATAEREHTVPIAPIVGAVIAAAGAAMLVVNRRRA